MNESDQVAQTRQCLLKIGDHILDITSHHRDSEVETLWRNNLWTFVSKFTSFEAKKLFKLYKHAAKKREETKSHERTQHKPSHHSQKLPSDPQKHGTGDLAPQRDLKRPMDGGGPGGKVPRMDRAYSATSAHSGGRHSGSGDGHDPRRPSSFSHSERPVGSSKDRHDYGHRYHDTHRDRPSHHSSDYSRSHERPSDHSRSHDQHSRSYERGADHHHSRSYDKRERRDDYHRSDTRDYSTESRHHSHRDRTSDPSLRHSAPSTSPKLSSTHDSKRYGEDKRTLDNDREKR